VRTLFKSQIYHHAAIVIRNAIALFLLFIFTMGASAPGTTTEDIKHTDAPALPSSNQNPIDPQKDSYEVMIKTWQTVYDVNNWIARNFRYDMQRAMQLASNSDAREKTRIYNPEELYNTKKGACIDLVRFAYETIKSIDSTIYLKYLIIEFEPLQMSDRIFRRHWLVIYRENNHLYLMADTKRPGHISGPYTDISNFINQYEQYRERRILSYKLTDTYKKKRKKKLLKKRLKQ